jgi:lysylphosphatidylglycerol synthetase-like protein (DUF2156 family)
MSTLPLITFIASAMLLFGTSNMLPDASRAMRGPLKRFLMQAVVSLAVLAAALFVILAHGFDPGNKRWAYGSLGMVVGYWLKSK